MHIENIQSSQENKKLSEKTQSTENDEKLDNNEEQEKTKIDVSEINQ